MRTLPDDMKLWKIMPPADKTWTKFKTDFALVYKELRKNIAVVQGFQADNVYMRYEFNEDMQDVMENLATATVSDCGAVATLNATTNVLTTKYATTTVPLVTALASNATFTTIIVSIRGNIGGGGGSCSQGQKRERKRKRKRGRGRGRDSAEPSASEPKGSFYYWSCGASCYYSSDRCCTKKDGNQYTATAENKINGLTESFTERAAIIILINKHVYIVIVSHSKKYIYILFSI